MMSKSIGDPLSDDVARTRQEPAAPVGIVRLPLESDAMPSATVVVMTTGAPAAVLHNPLITLNEIAMPLAFGTGLFPTSLMRTRG